MVMVPVGIHTLLETFGIWSWGERHGEKGTRRARGVEERGRERRRGMKGREGKIDSGKCACVHE